MTATATPLIPTTHDALLRAVLLAPHDDAPRLILADWCDENGQEDYAWYIREAIRCERGEAVNPFWQVNHEASRVQRPNLGESGTCLVWRGFVREIHITHDYFLEHAAAIFAAHPVERVILTDILVFFTSAGWRIDVDSMSSEFHATIDQHCGKFLDYLSREDAIDALSAACVDLGRECANLPPLTEGASR